MESLEQQNPELSKNFTFKEKEPVNNASIILDPLPDNVFHF